MLKFAILVLLFIVGYANSQTSCGNCFPGTSASVCGYKKPTDPIICGSDGKKYTQCSFDCVRKCNTGLRITGCGANCTPSSGSTCPTETPPCICGQRKSGARKTTNRIVGGTDALINEFPWRISMKLSLNGINVCGGSIISPNYILTAAVGTPVYVSVGDHDISTSTETVSQNVKIIEIKQHPLYNQNSIYNNDIALLKMEKPLIFSNTIMPVCLPFNYISTSFEGTMCMAGGWGTTLDGGTSATILQKVELPFMSTVECQKYLGSSVTNNMICTYKPGQDTCQGDSGGTIESRLATNFYTAIGIVSWGNGCAKLNNPGVYTKLTNYLTWIKENTAGESFCMK